MSDNKELGSDMPKANVVQNIKNTVRDISRLELLKPVSARIKRRLREITEMSSADTVVIKEGNVKKAYTEAPQMFISDLKATIEGGVGIISYGVYAMDKDGNKKLTNHIGKVADGVNADGSVKMRNVVSSSSFEIEKVVIERFVKGKPMLTSEE